jgi:hypothetical protein
VDVVDVEPAERVEGLLVVVVAHPWVRVRVRARVNSSRVVAADALAALVAKPTADADK